jgi:hypothetical protein
LFGGIWGFIGTTLAIVFSLVGGPFWNDLILDRRGVAAQARVTSVEPTSMRINERLVYRIDYTFADATGNPRAGSARTTRPETIVGAGRQAPLAIEYDPAAPARSRLWGKRASPVGPLVLMLLGFALVGGLLFALGGRRAVRLRAIYVRGQAALATVTGMTTSALRVNGRPVTRVAYAFDTPSGRTQGRTTLRAPPPLGASLWVLYDGDDPRRNVAA